MNIQDYLSGKPEDDLVVLPANRGHWQSIESVLADITDVVCLEKPVRHSQLQYCGVLDCLAEYRFEQCSKFNNFGTFELVRCSETFLVEFKCGFALRYGNLL